MGSKKSYLAVYGNVGLKKAHCQKCQCWAFVVEGVRQCCNRRFSKEPERWKRESLPEGVRRFPPAALRRMVLESQSHRCAYCEKAFGSSPIRYGQPVTLKVHWDHVTPFSFLQGNPLDNWVAACHVCNGWKSNLIFHSLTEVQLHVHAKWAYARHHLAPELSDLPDADDEEAPLAEVLLPSLPMEGLRSTKPQDHKDRLIICLICGDAMHRPKYNQKVCPGSCHNRWNSPKMFKNFKGGRP